ncbi:MAG: hypothetical protein ABW072_09380 [Sedimenticola sp.]
MDLLKQVAFLLRITHSRSIARRYFVVNGFDGALTMLGIILGFLVSTPTELPVVISACMGATIALAVSGVSSAYVSEMAEQRNQLAKLEAAMVADLQESAHHKAVRLVPILIALVNGAAPLSIALVILTPLWLAINGIITPIPPLHSAILVALFIIFLLGIYLGRISGISWLKSGLQTLLIALLTIILIYLFAGVY